jgi:CheY-like chemotaxis protein
LLVVDDNEEFTAALVPQLLGLGYQVEVAPSTEAALALVADGLTFDLVITDVQMRGLPGTELVDGLRQAGPLRALYMSGYTDRIALRRGPGKAESYFLKKPFSFDGLARMVRELLDAPAVGGEG